MKKETGFATSEQFHPALYIAAVQSLPLPIFDNHGGDGKWLSSLEDLCRAHVILFLPSSFYI